jgi:hypothetical protein
VSEAEEDGTQQLTRNLSELLQEIRVAQAGVQILFGFLLSVTFTDRYAKAGWTVWTTHLLTVLFAAAAVALLIAPAAWHRVLFRLGRREEIIAISNTFAVAGLVNLALAMVGTVLLVAELVLGVPAAVVCGVVVGGGFAVLWFVWPARRRPPG